MKKNIWITCFFLFYGMVSYGQTDLGISTRVGVGFGENIEINGEHPSNNISFNSRFGAYIDFPIYRSLHGEVGIGGKLFIGKGHLHQVDYNYKIARVDIEFLLKYDIRENLTIGFGVNLSTHRDFEGLDIHRHDNLRWNGMSKLDYQFSNRIDFNMVFTHAMNHIGNSYYIGTPRSSITIGMSYQLNFKDEE